MAIVRVRARVATTHAIPAYGGVQLAESALHQMAEAIAGGLPMRFQHDLARPIAPMNVTAGVEQMEDGELAVWTEFDIDEEVWGRLEAERLEAGAPGGFSFSTIEAFATRGAPPYDLVIAADASHFPAPATLAVAETLPSGLSVKLAELFQFSWVPEPKILIEIGMALLMSTPSDLLGLLLSDVANRLKAQLKEDAPAPTFELQVSRTPKTRTTQVKITAHSDEGLHQAMQRVPDILRAEGQAAFWDDQARHWQQVAAVQVSPDQAELGVSESVAQPIYDGEP
ncbi:hypothetical protein ACH4OY_15650 [Micromonospora rubida]|uniref:Uncharacterized protein n=1 Tax=Micromonospora rubida TaxID=2697657 RepID=A0ABW7SK76_9ACTN